MDSIYGNIREPARDVPVVDEVDVCVVGGSSTGVFAALAAARLGARVALIERLGYFGGSATAGLVCIWHSRMDTAFEREIVGGLPVALMERLKQQGAVMDLGGDESKQYIFSPPEMILALDAMVEETADIRPFLHTRFCHVVHDGNGRAEVAVLEDKSGRRAVRARVFIDASGDADLAYRMGFPTYKRSKLQPPTTCAFFQGLQSLRDEYPNFKLSRKVFNRDYPEALRPGFLWSADLPTGDLTMVAGTRVHGADCSDADQLTQAELEGRRQVRAILDILHRHVPGGKVVTLQGLPTQIGIRETRHVRCLHTLLETEVLYGRRFEDAITNGSYRVDVHDAEGDGLIFRYLDGREVWVGADGTRREDRWRPDDADTPTFYQIPYRCLVPQGSDNVLIAGRCLDADEGAFGAARVMINTSQMGQAAGTAAWLALKTNDVAAVDSENLRGLLCEQGAIVL